MGLFLRVASIAATALCTSALAAPMLGVGGTAPQRISPLPASDGIPGMQSDAPPQLPESPLAQVEKTVASGLYMSGQFTFVFSGGIASVTLDQINNTTSFTTGTLRLSLWATTYQPARGAAYNGFRLTNFASFNPLPPNNYYYNIARSNAYTAPPNGTYWIVLSLDQYNPAGCPSSTDGFCTEDIFVSFQQETWGPPAPVAALENPASGSYQSGIGLISGWSCQGPVSISVDGTSISAPYGSPRGDTAGICSGGVNNGFGLLVNYNNFGPGLHTAQLYVNGVASGNPSTFNVTVPSGEFMTGLSSAVTVPNFPSPGRTTTLIWQQSQQNFAIQSVFP